jgi:glycosyltransferase involved in cell wall biosynthesis
VPRVLHVVESFATGTMQVIADLTARLLEEGHPVGVAYGARAETPEALGDAFDGADLLPLPWRSRSPWAQVAAVRALRSLVPRWQPDVVHLHSSFAGAVGALAVPPGLPTVYTPHGSAAGRTDVDRLRRAAFVLAEHAIARRVTVLGAISESEARIARDVLRAPRVTAIPNGIPELDGSPDRPVAAAAPRSVAVLGRVTPARRPEACARIAAGLPSDVRFTWIGGGGSPAERAALEAAGVRITGWLDRSEAMVQLRQAGVLLHWSAWDGQSIALLEALANDVVVVASDIPPNRDVVGAEQVRSTEADAGALVTRILDDGALYRQMVEAQRHAGARYGARDMGTRWLRLYDRLASGERP